MFPQIFRSKYFFLFSQSLCFVRITFTGRYFDMPKEAMGIYVSNFLSTNSKLKFWVRYVKNTSIVDSASVLPKHLREPPEKTLIDAGTLFPPLLVLLASWDGSNRSGINSWGFGHSSAFLASPYKCTRKISPFCMTISPHLAVLVRSELEAKTVGLCILRVSIIT